MKFFFLLHWMNGKTWDNLPRVAFCHPLTHTTHTTTAFLPPPSSPSLPFLGCSSFFHLKGRIVWQLFLLLVDWSRERENSCYSLRLQLWEEVTTSSPESVHRRTDRHTHALQDLTTAATGNPLKQSGLFCNATLFSNFEGEKRFAVCLNLPVWTELLQRDVVFSSLTGECDSLFQCFCSTIETPVNHSFSVTVLVQWIKFLVSVFYVLIINFSLEDLLRAVCVWENFHKL